MRAPNDTSGSDVFISYTHIDNAPFGALGLAWVSHFHEQLETRLRQTLGERVEVWRDSKLAGNDVFDDALVERLAHVTALVAVCTPRYVRSEWCRREICEFVRAAETGTGVRVGSHSRLFKVLKTPVDPVALPGPLRELLGYELFLAAENEGYAREFLLDPHEQWRFYALLDDLAQDLTNLILEVRTTTPYEPADRETVYLAQTSSDMNDSRNNLRREFERRGYSVLPTQSLPLMSEDLQVAVRRDLDRSRLSLHPFGAHYGVRPEGELRSVPHLQFDLAREAAANNGLVTLAWLPPGVSACDEDEAHLVEDLALGRALSEHVEFLTLPLDSFKSYALAQIDRPSPRQPPKRKEGTNTRVYLVCDAGDWGRIGSCVSALESLGAEVWLPLEDGTESQARDVHRLAMVHADAVLVYYGTGTEYWLRMKLFDLVKAAGWGRREPYGAAAVYVAGPPTSHKEHFRPSGSVQLIKAEADPRRCLQSFTREAAHSTVVAS